MLQIGLNLMNALYHCLHIIVIHLSVDNAFETKI